MGFTDFFFVLFFLALIGAFIMKPLEIIFESYFNLFTFLWIKLHTIFRNRYMLVSITTFIILVGYYYLFDSIDTYFESELNDAMKGINTAIYVSPGYSQTTISFNHLGRIWAKSILIVFGLITIVGTTISIQMQKSADDERK